MLSPDELMKVAIDQACTGIRRGQSPFGCAIAIDGKIIAASYNQVLANTDITAHAEIQTIRQACQHQKSIFLTGAQVATTCEPCPMCMSALHWARVGTVYYGASIMDAQKAGFNELTVPAAQLLETGGSDVTLIGETCQHRCKQLFDDWHQTIGNQTY